LPDFKNNSRFLASLRVR